MKEMFLKNPEYMLVFAEEQEALQEAFTQATKHIQQKFVRMLAHKLREKGYNLPSLDFGYSNEFDFAAECDVLSVSENIAIKMTIGSEGTLNDEEPFWYGFWISSGNSGERYNKSELWREYANVIKGILGKEHRNHWWLWYKYFAYNKHDILGLARDESTFIDKCAAEITDSVKKLKTRNNSNIANGLCKNLYQSQLPKFAARQEFKGIILAG